MLLPRAEAISVSLCKSKRLKTTSSSSPSLPLDFCASFRVFFSFLPASLAPNRGSRSSRYVGFAWLGCVAAPVRVSRELSQSFPSQRLANSHLERTRSQKNMLFHEFAPHFKGFGLLWSIPRGERRFWGDRMLSPHLLGAG